MVIRRAFSTLMVAKVIMIEQPLLCIAGIKLHLDLDGCIICIKLIL